jgi:ElaB/YqjD/DUF883 family membrane-anchored ribosome-binding protein
MGQWDDQNQSQRAGANGHLANDEEAMGAHMQEMMENARQELETYVATAADFIRQRPVMCVAAAVGLGFLVGKIASRR